MFKPSAIDIKLLRDYFDGKYDSDYHYNYNKEKQATEIALAERLKEEAIKLIDEILATPFYSELLISYLINTNSSRTSKEIVKRILEKPEKSYTSELLLSGFELFSGHDFKENQANKEHHYDYIPLHLDDFKHVMEGAISTLKNNFKITPKTFIDVGCGYATKLIWAYLLFGLDPYGIEFTKQTGYTGMSIIKKFFANVVIDTKERCEKIIIGNALEYQEYGKYDIIYFYCPMDSDRMMEKLYRLMFQQLKEGGCVISVLTKGSFTNVLNEFRKNIIFHPDDNSNRAVVIIKRNGKFHVYRAEHYNTKKKYKYEYERND